MNLPTGMDLWLAGGGLLVAALLSLAAGALVNRANPGRRVVGETGAGYWTRISLQTRTLNVLSLGIGLYSCSVPVDSSGQNSTIINVLLVLLVSLATFGPQGLLRRRHNLSVGPNPEPA